LKSGAILLTHTVLPESCRLTANDGDSSDDGKIVFLVNGQNVYESGNYGYGVRFGIGEGCDEIPDPTPAPTPEPTPAPIRDPTPAPTTEPTPTPVRDPTPAPTPEPTPAPIDDEAGECSRIVLEVHADGWAEEISIEFTKSTGEVFTVPEGTFENFSVTNLEDCVDLSACSVLTIFDSYGDGYVSEQAMLGN
jgi:hypothetical protein